MRKIVTLIPGDGIGPEISEALMFVMDKIKCDIDFEIVDAGLTYLEKGGQLIPNDVYDSIEKTRCVIKGPITTPIQEGFRSINVFLRKKYDLYQNIRPVKGISPSLIDFVIFRENTEGLYIGEEKDLGNGITEATKRITRVGSNRIIQAAFEYASMNHRKKVTVIHKANILKVTDGLFLSVAREIKEHFPEVQYEEMIIDNACMQMVMNPMQFDVIVTMNLYGDILSDLGAGLVGGLGLAPGANIGSECAIFEAVHGSAPNIAGKGIANPVALLRSAVMMLSYLGETENSNKLDLAINQVLEEKMIRTPDLGGTNTTMEMAEVITKRFEMIR
ncbi:MAG: isocitrate/isopropylmalate dehydrogenase family protein [Candidatus Izemoplasmatales bacterium]